MQIKNTTSTHFPHFHKFCDKRKKKKDIGLMIGNSTHPTSFKSLKFE